MRKFANVLNGVDLTDTNVGDVLTLQPHHAAMLIDEGWAVEAGDGPEDAARHGSTAKTNTHGR